MTNQTTPKPTETVKDKLEAMQRELDAIHALLDREEAKTK